MMMDQLTLNETRSKSMKTDRCFQVNGLGFEVPYSNFSVTLLIEEYVKIIIRNHYQERKKKVLHLKKHSFF